MSVFIEEGNRLKSSKTIPSKYGSKDAPDVPHFRRAKTNGSNVPFNDDDIIRRYEAEKESRKIECFYMMKVSDEMSSVNVLVFDKTRFDVFDRNDELINTSLKTQFDNLQSKLRHRKLCRIRNGSLNRGIWQRPDEFY